jgi:hypothetical protein
MVLPLLQGVRVGKKWPYCADWPEGVQKEKPGGAIFVSVQVAVQTSYTPQDAG